MIPDKVFKALNHACVGYTKQLNGQTLSRGYKPDYVLKNGDRFIIMESEAATSRKTFVGGLVKAANFLQAERNGSLIFVIVPKANINVAVIAKHLKPYLEWLRPITNLRDVYVIEAGAYYSATSLIMLFSEEFFERATKV